MPAYLTAIFLAFLVWIFLFSLNKYSRREMIITGSILTPFAILDNLTTPSYWKPVTLFNLPVGIEGFLFTFLITGIAAVIYEVVYRKRYKGTKLHLSFCIAFILPVFIAGFSVFLLKLNIIYFFILGFTFMALAEVIKRRDLIINSVLSAVLFSIVYFLTFSVWLIISPDAAAWWSRGLTGIKVLALPLEELMFSLSLGFFVGPLYEYLTCGKIFNIRKK